MSKYAVASLGERYIVNASLFDKPNTQTFVLVNGTFIQLRLHEPYKDSQLNELLYVIIVIVFYATALMTLIITQIKRQRREGTEVDYYDEYLQRNSEVKRTCQAANTIVSKQPSNTQSQRVTAALASAAVAAASAGSIMGSPFEEQGSALLKEERETDTVVEIRGAGGRNDEGTGAKQKGDVGFGLPTSGAVGGILTPLISSPKVGNLPITSYGNSRITLARERSPTRMLESIPDEGGEE